MLLLRNKQKIFICTFLTLCALKLIRGEEVTLVETTTRTATVVENDNTGKTKNKKKVRVALIGGGIGGSFTAKYLSDYDKGCSTIDSITIYEPYSIISDYGDDPLGRESEGEDDNSVHNTIIPYPAGEDGDSSTEKQQKKMKHQQQGPRTSSVKLSDGTIVELGASILFNGNKLAVEMVKNDDSLDTIEPLSGNDDQSSSSSDEMKEGMGIYNGYRNSSSTMDDELVWPVYTSNLTKEETSKALLWRYNLDLYRIDKATNAALASFEKIYDLIETGKDETGKEFHYESPNDLWEKAGLKHAALTSLDDFLDDIGISKGRVSWWKRFLLGGQGLVRDELFAPMNICNNNKNNAQMTGLAGLVNFVASKGQLFAIKGGNQKLVQSAFKQAQSNYEKSCSSIKDDNEKTKIEHIPVRIKTVVSDFESTSKGMELFDTNGKKLGAYDIVILAAPIQFSGINFLTKGSLFDRQALQPMSLNNGIVDTTTEGSNSINANDHGHRVALAGGNLPDSAKRPYTKVVTTIVSHAKLNKSHFFMEDGMDVPKSILFTQKGKEEVGISSIGWITSDIFKVFSSNKLSKETLSSIFGADVIVEFVKIWGEDNGGATPDFNGGGDSSFATDFVLYDGGHGVGGLNEEGSALYYVNSMESAVSAIEISAIGAKAVAKLVGQRLGLFQTSKENHSGEEL